MSTRLLLLKSGGLARLALRKARVCTASSFARCGSGSSLTQRTCNGISSRSWQLKDTGVRFPLRAAERQTQSVRTMATAKELAWEPEKLPQVTTAEAAAADWEGDLLAVGVFQDALDTKGETKSITSDALKSLDSALGGVITEFITLNEFEGKPGSSVFARLGGKARYVGVVGLGPADKAKAVATWGQSVYQMLGAAVASAAKTHKAKTAAVALPDGLAPDAGAAAAAKVATGVLLGAYEATRFKAKPALSPLEGVTVLGVGEAAAAALHAAESLARGTLLARFLVEAPANICTPTYLADVAAKIAALNSERMSLEVLERERIAELKMGLYLGVAEASDHPPKFIHLTYTPKGEVKKRIGIVGKGLTFDSGGYNIKAGAGSMIEMMKFDMGGSAAAFGAARALSAIEPEGVEVHFIVASCENMIDGKGCRPGDVLTASNGKTVEVNNTDAEGRLTMADALIFAQEQCKVQAVVDIATLTGACMVALGNGIGGLFTPSDDMAEALSGASREAGEKLWRMPMEDSYWEIMKSPIADMKNAGNRLAGAITAALFLKEYVATDTVEWAHIDIAGPAWDEKQGGATGFGASLLAQWAIAQGT